MTFQTEYQAIPTEYNGVEFRSKLEAKTANALDNIGIEWEYEPQFYQLSNGLWYKPDFWLPAVGIFVECKAEPYQDAVAKAHCLASDTVRAVLIMGYEWAKAFKPWGDEIAVVDQDCGFFLAKCRECGCWYLTSGAESYECPNCGYYDGDRTFSDEIHFDGVTDLFNEGQRLAAVRYAEQIEE